MSSPTLPSAAQLAENRSALWHQNDTPLFTVEALRPWIHRVGLVLFTPRPQQLPAPAPSLVEAVLGKSHPDATLTEMADARSMLARLIAEGNAVPLNLLGTAGDTPDFVVSAAVFAYVFTLRGDKAWKQPPATSGPVKVSPLALAAYEVLARRVTLSVPELVSELGKEVTETAVLRALSELWSHLRVVPVPQTTGDTMWELMSTRFTKQIKAGANAGQPKALSALISLYLGTALVATEEEIETILSPLAPRSRIRDVVHALMGARELETIAIDGRTVVHIAGDLPQFASPEASEAATEDSTETIEVDSLNADAPTIEGSGSIKKFVPKPAKTGTGFARKFTPRTESGDRERRPFKKPFDGPSKPSFTKPWDENRPPRPAAAEGDSPRSFDRPERRPFSREQRPSFSSKPYGAKPSFGSKPRFGSSEGGTRPTFRRDDNAPRDFTPRPSADGPADSTPRRTFSKPGTFGRKREGGFSPRPAFGAKPPFGARPSFGDRPSSGAGEGRPPRRDFGGKPSFGSGEGRPPRRDFTPREGGSSDRPRRDFNGERPAFGDKPREARRPGSYSPRPTGGDRKPYSPRPEGQGGFPPRKPFTPGAGKPFSKPGFSRDRDMAAGADAPRKTFRKFDAPRFDKPKRPFNPDGPKPSGYPAKKPFSKPTGAGASRGPRPPGTFAKFADGAKPFRKPGPGGKKFSPKPGGKPEYRKRKPEDGEQA